MNNAIFFPSVRRLGLATGLLVLLAAAAPSWAAPAPPKDNTAIEVPQTRDNHPGASVSARNVHGAFAVVWITQNYINFRYETTIWARSYTAEGAPRGPQFKVATVSVSGHDYQPDVAIDADGNIVVVWAVRNSNGDAPTTYAVKGRRFDASGAALGPVFTAAQATSGEKQLRWVDRVFGARDYRIRLHGVAVAMAPDGRFTVAWKRVADPTFDPAGRRKDLLDTASVEYNIKIRRYGTDGTARKPKPHVVAQFRRSNTTFGIPTVLHASILFLTFGHAMGPPTLAVNADGDFVVTWSVSRVAGGFVLLVPFQTAYTRIYARRFTNGNVLQSDPRRLIARYRKLPGQVVRQSVDIAPDGTYVVAWSECSRPAIRRGKQQPCTIKFRRMGSGSGAEVEVADASDGAPKVGIADNGTVLVGWSRHARVFGAQDQALTAVFEVTQLEGETNITSVNAGGAPGFLVTWDQTLADATPARYDNETSVFARRFSSQ